MGGQTTTSTKRCWFGTELLRVCLSLGSSLLLLCSLSSVSAQDEPAAKPAPPANQRIFEGEPFDRLTLDEKNESAVIKVRPIPFPNRTVPVKPKPTDKLKVKLLDDARDFEVTWYNISKLELFESIVLEEAKSLLAAGKLDEVYDYLFFLLNNYPNTPGLADARQSYLYAAAGQAFRQKRYSEALGVLEELRSLNPDFRSSGAAPTIMQIVGSTADNLIGGYVAKEDYRSARILLERLVRTYQAGNEPFAMKWQTQLSEMAVTERDKAKALLEQKKFVEAYDASSRMRNIWPTVAGGNELLIEMARRYPLVSVGVTQPAKSFDSRSMIDPAARRAGRLVQRQLTEFSGMGPEGGRYSSPIGEISRSDDGRYFTLEVNGDGNRAAPVSPFDVAQRLLQLADESRPDSLPAWTRLVSAIQVKQTQLVQIDLRLPHVLPEALLQIPVAPPADKDSPGDDLGPYRVLSTVKDNARFVRNDASPFVTPTQPAEIVERLFDDPQRMLLALKRGEVDVVDQVFPSDVIGLKSDPAIAIAQYSAPTTHMLLFNRSHPYLANRTFRRALLYASDRQTILQQGLLKGQTLPGWRVISGPFPAPANSSDNIAYGYDEQVLPRAYDPRLAIVLKVLAQREMKSTAEKSKKELPKWQPLVLGHPADETSRLACRALVKQWQIAGFECKLQEFPPGVFADPQEKCDLTYVQAATWEPIIDASRLFSTEGITPTDNAFIRLAIRQIETATNWQQVRQRMQQLHQLVHEDVSVLPLWQTYDYYAYRRGITALETDRVTLFQNVQQWQPETKLVSK
ncbi:Bacterial extracellular solute-binding protein, family 5 Middle [Anatilimnocola aggregata]|uniref:Bacterial extracellular solute-binding protein, family 5 Middle n=1 Tax=Anatilimnocola aggregata TaxID=2528021 RepID=A0A517YCP4_9BACT|nr:ABC transporter substrate-binding protein [Anatilimnocola aggregata]QDU28001.1 Bacterial extracellular solute-binding protein, family 5 Middle [Anatilimnocola aggregata]